MAEATELKRTLEVEIPESAVSRAYTRVARDFQKHARLPGFRPGHAPLQLVEKRFEEKIRQEVLEALLPEHLNRRFEEEKLEPVGQPVLEDLHFHQGEPIRFKASFEVMPEIVLGDYASIRVEAPEVAISDEDIEQAIERFRSSRSTQEEVSGEARAERGMVAVVRSERQLEGEENVEKVEETWIEIGGDDTLPEFTSALEGLRIGEEREFAVAYPENYPNASVQGKSAHYKVELKGLKRRVLPELTDEWVQSATEGAIDSVQTLRTRLGERIARDRRHEAEHATEEKVLDQLLERHDFAVPEALVDKQIETRLERNLRMLAAQGIDPRKLKLDWSEIRAGQQEQASREVRVSLLLDRLARELQLEPSDADIEQELERLAAQVQQSVEQIRPRLTAEGALDRIKARLRSEQAMAWLYRSATGVELHRAEEESI